MRGKKRPSGLKVSRLTVLSAQFTTRSTKFLIVLKMFQFLVLHLGLSSDATYKGAADNQLSTVRACCPPFFVTTARKVARHTYKFCWYHTLRCFILKSIEN